jgi:hypothetical protein
MWTQVEHLDTYFNLTFEKIIYENMVSKLRNEVEIMDIPIDYKNNVLDQFADWCKEHKPNTETVRYIAERLLLLENRFGDECDFWNMQYKNSLVRTFDMNRRIFQNSAFLIALYYVKLLQGNFHQIRAISDIAIKIVQGRVAVNNVHRQKLRHYKEQIDF